MPEYNSDNKFKISSDGRGSGILIYNLYQDGWDKGKPRMVNDITIQIHGNNASPEQISDIADFVQKFLNKKYFKGVNTIGDFYNLYYAERQNYPQQRAGQFAFNLMHEVRPEQANKHTGTNLDPFHNDEMMHDFIKACFE